MENNAVWVNLIFALITGGVGTAVVNSVVAKVSGKADRRRQDNKDLAETANLAERREDWERSARIQMETFAATLTLQVIQLGGTPPDRPNLEALLGPKP